MVTILMNKCTYFCRFVCFYYIRKNRTNFFGYLIYLKKLKYMYLKYQILLFEDVILEKGESFSKITY
jgi:hypothetical protein